jgi:drug/metabolite transporter (DMT)-like permease
MVPGEHAASTLMGVARPTAGIGYYALGLACVSLFDACAKWLVTDYPIPQIVFIESAIGLILASCMAFAQGIRPFHSQRLDLQILRGVLTSAVVYFFFSGLKFFPLADLTAVVSAAPLFMATLAVPLLGEHVSTRVKLAVCTGFLGVLLILQPNSSVQWALILPLGCALCYALVAILSRMLADDDPWTTVAYSNLILIVFSAPMLPLSWVPVVPGDWGLLLLMAVMGTVGVYFRVKAVVYTPVSTLAPFDYTHIVWAVVFGYIIWGEFPDPLVWIGASTIVISGLYILWPTGYATSLRGTGLRRKTS